MKPKIAILLLLAAALAPSPPAFGLGGDHKDYAPGESISHPDNWPPRLVKLASLPSRVAGYFCNADDYLAFKGDTTGFQAFLDTCGALGEFAPTTLHIHKGQGSFQSLDKEKKAVPCDWRLDVINQHFRATEPNPKGPMYGMELHVWPEGAVDFAAIKVPPSVKVIQEANPPVASPASETKPEKSPIKSSPTSGDNIEEAARIGTETATADIKADTFLILEYGEPRQIKADTKDPQTGFRIQSVAGCKVLAPVRAEADAYNQVMRDWHAKNLQSGEPEK